MPVKTGAKRHTHQYQRMNGLWCCALEDCTHYMPKNVEGMILGKLSICWSCEVEFRLNRESLTEPRPTCDKCRTETETLQTFLKEKGL